METFRTRPEDFYKIKGMALIISNIISVAVLLGISSYAMIESGVDFGGDDTFPIFLMCAVLIMMITVSIAIAYKYFKRERDNWLSTQVEIDEEGLSVKTNTLNLRLQRSEITRILEYQDKGLHIQTADKYKGCFIFKDVHRYDELRNCLANWLDIESVASRKYAYLLVVLYILIFGAMSLIVFFSAEKYLVLPCGIVVLGGAGVYLWTTYRTKGADLRVKLGSCGLTLWICLVIVIKILSMFK